MPLVADRASKNGLLRAGELARASGVSTDTLRYYERKGLLASRRSANGYREYPAEALDRVRLVRTALALGFRLDDLARILKARSGGAAPCRQVRALAAAKLDELETLVQGLTAMRDEMRALLADWDKRLDSTGANEPARLLEALAATDFTAGERLALITPPWRKRKQKRKESK